jgi:hypothetical protein
MPSILPSCALCHLLSHSVHYAIYYQLPVAKAKGDQPKWVLPISPNARTMTEEFKYLEKKTKP